MYFAHCYNYDAGDTFYAFGNTKKEALEMLEKAYKDSYGMTNRDAKESGYKTILDYICHEKEVEVLNIKTINPIAYVHGYNRTYCKDYTGKVYTRNDDRYVEYISVDD